MTKKRAIDISDPLFGFYERLSYHQIDLRDKLHTRFQIFLVGAIPLAGYLATLFNKTAPVSLSLLPAFAKLALLSFGAILSAAYFFILSYCGNKYSFMAYANNIEDYRKHPNITLKEFREYLLEDLIDTSSKNALVNDRRSRQISMGNYFFIAAVILAIAASSAYWYKKPEAQIETVKIIVDQPVKVKGAYTLSEKPKPPTQTAPNKPPRPPQREVRENDKKKR